MKNFTITIETGSTEPPKSHEMRAAEILKHHFQSDLTFIRKGLGRSPDIRVEKNNQVWELKSPVGNGKRTMDNNLRKATGQSRKVIIDLARCKMNSNRALARIIGFTKTNDCHIKRLKVITKSKKVIDIL